ncbi:DUF4145 domain-containing protein [Arachidicoccus terrestris]|uniref:DUF4145 domain-containing protein n=1 Tax=Arachidicoccus terrestris TaxID=2875539 RepID=UPI001CC43FCB|nr:DUF4145 domain-containing protein [Arachidicoccus terrestris]UAY55682.1 DUF4145 domain-containing protein [Arachidicoccus terrestris]
MLRYIPFEGWKQTANEVNYKYPISVNTNCPHCKVRVNYKLSWATRTKIVEYAKSSCPSCQKLSIFIFITKASGSGLSGDLFINPSGDVRHSLSGIEDAHGLSTGIKNAYYSTIQAFNGHQWIATTVLCRRVLEGIVKGIVNENGKNGSPILAQQLKQLPDQIDFSKPILTLADAIRKAGNIGAHFDEDKEPDQEVAESLMDVLDYLIEYLFILPSQIEQLHNKIEKLGQSDVQELDESE